MNVALRKPITLDQFLAWEERQELRYEFDGFQPLAMTGGTAAHAAIQRNLLIALGVGLRGRSCQPFGSELKIQVTAAIRYPDAPSVQRYVVLQQTKAAAAVFSRKGEDWVSDLLAGPEAILRMPEIDLDIPLSEIYRGIEFEPEDAEEQADQNS